MNITGARRCRSATIMAVVVLAATTSFHAAARADSLDSPPMVPVSYAGLDLSTRAGATTLYKRIDHAAQQVCHALAGRDLALHAKWVECYEQAVSAAVSKVNRPTLTALYEERTGHASAERAMPAPVGLTADR